MSTLTVSRGLSAGFVGVSRGVQGNSYVDGYEDVRKLQCKENAYLLTCSLRNCQTMTSVRTG